tara:strand:- start:119 stop:787 length:669 start_codon:yes stop_codon:yes gene_type:complete
MVSKLIILILIVIFNIKTGLSNIIYDKNGISITDIEINNYINLYKTNYDINVSKNKAIKNIVLIKKSINFLNKNNPDFMKLLDENINSEYGSEILNNQSLLNFIRFQKIRNEFITEYFQNNFNLKELEVIFYNLNNLKIPISKNDCLTVERLHEVSLDKNLIKSFYENLRSNQKKIVTVINEEKYDVCINNKLFKNIEYEIIKYIENKTEEDFEKFLYGKLN